MPRRYVPKTYNNRRVLRLIIGMAITFALSAVILFLSLFFIFSRYVVDGQIILPFDEAPATTAPPLNETPGTEPTDADAASPESNSPDTTFPDSGLPDLTSPNTLLPPDSTLPDNRTPDVVFQDEEP